MKNIPLEVTHSLSFLSSMTRDAESVKKESKKIIEELYRMDLSKNGAPGQIRKKSNDFRDDMDDTLELIVIDYKLFHSEMTDIIQNKHTETVIYSLRQYKSIYNEYVDLQKDIEKIYLLSDTRKNQCERNKDYIKLIAINKVSVPIFRLNELMKHIITRLETLVK